MRNIVASAVNWLYCVGFLPKNSKISFYAVIIATQIYLQISRVLPVNVLRVTKTSVSLVVNNKLPVHKLVAKSNILSSSACLMTRKYERLPVGPYKCIMAV